MRKAITVLLLALAAGCGSEKAAVEPMPSPSTASETPSASPTAPIATTLKDTCPQVEAALKGFDSTDAQSIVNFANATTALIHGGDLETQNALQPIMDALVQLANAKPGQQFLSADQAMLSSVDDLAKRCRVGGSSALQ